MIRARRWFWTLTAVAALALGTLSRALTASPGPLAGVAVAAAGTIFTVATFLALRILVRLEPARRKETP